MPYLTVRRLCGDPDDLLARKQANFDPVTRALAPQCDAIFSITAQAVDGLVIVNLWESPEGPSRFAQVAQVQQAQLAAGLPPPSSFDRYEQVECEPYRQQSSWWAGTEGGP